MSGFFDKIKEKMGSTSDIIHEAEEEGYVELGTDIAEAGSRINVRPFVIDDFETSRGSSVSASQPRILWNSTTD